MIWWFVFGLSSGVALTTFYDIWTTYRRRPKRARGKDLDKLARVTGLERKPGESDKDFRNRLRKWMMGGPN